MTSAGLVRSALTVALPAVHAAAVPLWTAPGLGERYPRYLRAMHGLMRASVPLLEDAAGNLDAGDPLGAYFRAHAAQERGHDTWLLEDLAMLGAAAPDPMEPDVAALAGAQYYWVRHRHPACLLGYIAVLEGCPPDPRLVSDLPRRTGLPVAAFRTLAWHAAQDPGHLAELACLLDALVLPAAIAAAIARNVAYTAAASARLLRRLAISP